MQQALNAIAQIDKRAKMKHPRHMPDNRFSGNNPILHRIPRAGQKLFHAQANAPSIAVDSNNYDIDLITRLHGMTRVLDLLPGKLRYVHQAIRRAKVHEGAELAHAADRSTQHLPFVQLREQLFFFLFS